LIRLDADEDTLDRRVRGREIGSALEDQLTRTRRQAVDLRERVDQQAVVSRTDNRSVVEIADELRRTLEWG
jgi:hypothetical protein